MGTPTIWVVENDDGWGIRREGDHALLSRHRTQAEVADAGRPVAEGSVELIRRRADGGTGGRDSHGNDPFDMRG